MKRTIKRVLAVLICFLICFSSACGKETPVEPVVPGGNNDTAATTESDVEGKTENVTDSDESSSITIEPLDNFVLEVDNPYITEEESALFSVQLSEKYVLQAPLELLCEGEKIGELTDDGQNGDRRSGDGIYSLLVEKPVQDRKASLFSARYGEQESESVAVNLFRMLTEEEVQKEQEALKPLRETLQSVSAQDWTSEKRSEIETILQKLQEEGTIRLYEIDEIGCYIKLNSGLGCIFNPTSEGTMASGANTQMEIAVYEASDFKMPYPNSTAKEIDDLLPNYSQGTVYKGEKCDRDAVKNLHANQIVLWNGHGMYFSSSGPVLELGESFNWIKYFVLFHNDWDFQFDIAHDLIMNNALYDDRMLISSKYFDKYCGDLSGSFICLNSCYGMKTNELSDAFLNKGAVAVYGYSDVVMIKYCSPTSSTVIRELMTVDQASHDFHTLKEAVNLAKEENGDTDIGVGGIGAAPKIGGGSSAENYRLSKAGAVYGTITDTNGKKISGAQITFQRIGSGGKKKDYIVDPQQSSNKSGQYEVWLLPTKFVIQVEAEGCEPYSKEISISSGDKLLNDIKLTAKDQGSTEKPTSSESKTNDKGKVIKKAGMEVYCPSGWSESKDFYYRERYPDRPLEDDSHYSYPGAGKALMKSSIILQKGKDDKEAAKILIANGKEFAKQDINDTVTWFLGDYFGRLDNWVSMESIGNCYNINLDNGLIFTVIVDDKAKRIYITGRNPQDPYVEGDEMVIYGSNCSIDDKDVQSIIKSISRN